MLDSLTIGRVTGVHGFRIRVELDASSKSPSRAGLAGVQTAVAINSYLYFEMGASEIALGVITDLEAMETLDPYNDDGMSLELVKPRRTASVQLLGTIRATADGREFDPGITVLPTLDTLARVATAELLDVVFRDAPKRNPPGDVPAGEKYDHPLELGTPVASRENRLYASYNDLFSRPLAIVGNTGSGKSYTVASLLQRALDVVGNVPRPRFFVFDINGEYGRAFDTPIQSKSPDEIYLNGKPFSVPVWLMNAREVCSWLGAAEQTQEPVLKDFWSVAKGGSAQGGVATVDYLSQALIRLDSIEQALPTRSPVNRIVQEAWANIRAFISPDSFDGVDELQAEINKLPRLGPKDADFANFPNHRLVLDLLARIRLAIQQKLPETRALAQESADKPIYFATEVLNSPKSLLEAVRGQDDEGRLRQWIATLQLRLNTRLADKRWQAFYSYDKRGHTSFESWLRDLGIGAEGRMVNVIDCSMLGYEILPYVCGIIGRTLLELRERVEADKRFKEPWVIVLEEAHNYVRPVRQDEDKGIGISRQAFERIAKEGRKFGLSMIVASQRPSEISQTIVSQCANFVMHRLQNPDDIEHFKSIVPAQSRRLLDQISILSSGEAITFGSAFHVPTRVQVHAPAKTPWSQTAAPYWEWQPKNSKPVDVPHILKEWGLSDEGTAH